MESSRLKDAIAQGSYHPSPEQVAQAMLRRRGVRALLLEAADFSPVDRIRPLPPSRHRAA